MDIKKSGRGMPDWERDFDCEGCGVLLTIKKPDLFLAHERGIIGNRDYVMAVCRACEAVIVVDNPAHADWGELPTWKGNPLERPMRRTITEETLGRS